MRHVVVGLFVALLLVLMISAASAAASWYLTAINATGTEGEMNNTYYMTPFIGNTSGPDCNSIAIPDTGDPLIWITNESALVDVAFPETSWDITLKLVSTKNIGKVNFSIGYYNITTETFTAVNTEPVNLPDGNKWYKNFTIDTASFTIVEGDYLAYQILDPENTSGDALTVDVCYSSVTYPGEDITWPVPELSTFVLMAVGLLALVGYLRYRIRA